MESHLRARAALTVVLPEAWDALPLPPGLPKSEPQPDPCAEQRVLSVAQPLNPSPQGAKSPPRDKDLGCSHSLPLSSGSARLGQDWQGWQDAQSI